MWAKLIVKKLTFVYMLIRLGHQHSYAVFVSFMTVRDRRNHGKFTDKL